MGTQADDSELPYLLCWANSPAPALPTPSALNERKGQGPAAQALVLPAESPEPPWPAMEAEPHLLTRGSEPQTAWLAHSELSRHSPVLGCSWFWRPTAFALRVRSGVLCFISWGPQRDAQYTCVSWSDVETSSLSRDQKKG